MLQPSWEPQDAARKQAQMTASGPTPREVIEEIRLRKFGLNSDGRTAHRHPLSRDLHEAIRRLSEDLYSKDIHFVLELIQNAEDNTYDPNVKPDLTLILSSTDPTATQGSDGALILVNNEVGFNAQNVEALCAVGVSTKKKREGYVGEKGIGFKSVFLVTSAPHIFSAGYRFRFQEQADPAVGTGYIVPYWVPAMPPELEPYSQMTCIVLPLKPGKRQEVASSLQHIAPETILFLSKLQGLTIQIEGQANIEVVRDDTRKPLVQFMAGDRYAEFWLVEREVSVPDDIREEKRVGVTTRKVSVACPLSAEEDGGRVFAFLPTEVISGFPFLINADFILSSSRERIQLDRPWNHWLRDEVAPVFVEAFQGLVESRLHRAQAYSFIPLAEDVAEPFFEPIVGAIHQELRDRPVVWAHGKGDALLEPGLCRLASPDLRKILNGRTLPMQLQQTPLVHSSIQPYYKQLQAIGVEYLSRDEFLNCLRDEEWLASHDALWFAELYGYLAQQKWATRETLAGIKLLRAQGGELLDAGTEPVYFPDGADDIFALYRQVSSSLSVRFLDERLYERIKGNSDLKAWVATVLGVKTLSQASFCLDLVRMLNLRYAELSVDDLITYTAHIRDQFRDLDEKTRAEIVRHLPLALADGRIIRPKEWTDTAPLVMPETMDRETGWQLVFPDAEDRLHMSILSDAYLAKCDKNAIGHWRLFFQKVGATEAPFPRQLTYKWYWSGDQPTDIHPLTLEQLQGKLEYSTRAHKLTDWKVPVWLDRLGQQGKIDHLTEQRCKALLKWLEHNRTRASFRYYGAFHLAEYEWHYYCWHSRCMDSAFMMRVKNALWFPSTKGPRPPREVFLNRPELREIFGDVLAYATEDVSEELAKLLEVRWTATVDEILKYLQHLASQPPENANSKVLAKIYAFLDERWRPDIKDRFAAQPLILAFKPKPCWVTSQQALWPDRSTVFDDTYAYLEGQYENLRSFFVERLGVASELSPEVYARAWRELANRRNADADAVEAALERIYPKLLHVAEQEELPDWWAEVMTGVKVWTQSDRFECPSRVFVPDDGDLKQLFTLEGVEFAWRPEKASFRDYEALYRALGVRSLAASTKVTAKVQGGDEPQDGQLLLTNGMKRCICFYLRNTNRAQYDEAKETGTLERLLRTRERKVESLSVRYELDGKVVTVPDAAAYWAHDEAVLYLGATCPVEQRDIDTCAILARRLLRGNSTDLENLIGRTLGASDALAERIIQKHNWSLPLEERRWLEGLLADEEAQAEPEMEVEPDEPTTPDADAEPTSGGEEDLASTAPDMLAAELETTLVGTSTGGGGTTGGATGRRGDSRGDGPTGSRRTGSGHGSHTGTGSTIPSARSDDGERKPGTSQRREGRLRSYVEPKRTDPPIGTDSTKPEEHKQVEDAGMRVAMAYERRHGWTPQDVARENKGYDIRSIKGLKEVRHIEVKALSGAWSPGSPAALSEHEYDVASELGSAFWLYVVEQALSDTPILHRIQDPANKINQYCLDDGWRALAETSETQPDHRETEST